jgi:hypothetical protein
MRTYNTYLQHNLCRNTYVFQIVLFGIIHNVLSLVSLTTSHMTNLSLLLLKYQLVNWNGYGKIFQSSNRTLSRGRL